MPNNFREDNFI